MTLIMNGKEKKTRYAELALSVYNVYHWPAGLEFRIDPPLDKADFLHSEMLNSLN